MIGKITVTEWRAGAGVADRADPTNFHSVRPPSAARSLDAASLAPAYSSTMSWLVALRGANSFPMSMPLRWSRVRRGPDAACRLF